jgi:hypothetical protein
MRNNSNILSTGNFINYFKDTLESTYKLFLHGLLLLVLVYLFKQSVVLFWLKPTVLIIGFSVWLFNRNLAANPLFWSVWFLYFFITLGRNYYLVANHHFVVCYVLAAVILHQITNLKNESYLHFHVRFILLTILMFGAFQKLLSPAYISGAFFQLEMDMNYFLQPLNFIVPEWQEITNGNKDLYKKLIATNPNAYSEIQLKYPIHHSTLLAKKRGVDSHYYGSYYRRCHFFGNTNASLVMYFLLVRLVAYFFFRLETGFLTLLATLGLLLSPTPKISMVYITIILIFSVLMATELGLR